MLERHSQAFLDLYAKNFVIGDHRAPLLVVGLAVAHFVPGEPLWVRIFGASRSGKTELINSFLEHRDTRALEVVTPAAIKGSLAKGHRVLSKIDGKLVITKDFAAMLSAKTDARNEVFGLLRNVKDGSLQSDFGTEDGGGPQKATFDWLVATTPVFSQYRNLDDQLGARFIDLKWPMGDRLEMAKRAASNSTGLKAIRADLAKEAVKLLNWAKMAASTTPPSVDEAELNLLADWADLTAMIRTPVSRDHYHNLNYEPLAEAGTEIAQAFTRITKALKMMGVDNWRELIARLAWDSIPSLRTRLITKILSKPGTSAIETGSASVRSYALEDLKLLEIVSETDGAKTLQIRPELEPRLRHLASFWKP